MNPAELAGRGELVLRLVLEREGEAAVAVLGQYVEDVWRIGVAVIWILGEGVATTVAPHDLHEGAGVGQDPVEAVGPARTERADAVVG